MPKKVQSYPLLPLFRKFINDIKKGKHLQKNGRRIKPVSINNYLYLEKALSSFTESTNFQLRLIDCNRLSKKEFADEKNYWKTFYYKFTNYLYDELNHYDNYVGRLIKLLKSFLNYVNFEKGINIGQFYKNFHVPNEDIDIVVLTPERINALVSNKQTENMLDSNLIVVKDIFLFGCTVALRFSDLMNLKKGNVEKIGNKIYIKVQSKKTQTHTRVKLPDFAIEILNKYVDNNKLTILPKLNKAYMNKKIKILMEAYGFTEPIMRSRNKRGIPIPVFKDPNKKTNLRFCDAVTTHTMRRTAITSMLSLGLNEQVVRQISGHSPGSKEFHKYVSYAQTYLDEEIDTMYERLKIKN